jgi:DnaK suppressor protein
VRPNQHFDEKFFMAQKKKLLELKQELIMRIGEKSLDDLHVPVEEVIEDGDQAQTYSYQNLSFGLRERELYQLREIEAALMRIEMGSYGICEDTDEPIGKKRLEKMPWTRLSIQAAEAEEREKQFYVKPGA